MKAERNCVWYRYSELNLNSLLGSFGQGLKELKLEGISNTANDLTITSQFSFPDLEIFELKQDFRHINDHGVLSILGRTTGLKSLILVATKCTLREYRIIRHRLL